MTGGVIAVAVLCQLPLVAGQIFLKRAMGSTGDIPKPRAKVIVNFVAGVSCLTLWFFVWLGLLQQQELSKIFPFEGLNPALMVIAAWIFLKEKIPAAAWVGVGLICVGIALVSGS